jgi:hypothetical protein
VIANKPPPAGGGKLARHWQAPGLQNLKRSLRLPLAVSEARPTGNLNSNWRRQPRRWLRVRVGRSGPARRWSVRGDIRLAGRSSESPRGPVPPTARTRCELGGASSGPARAWARLRVGSDSGALSPLVAKVEAPPRAGPGHAGRWKSLLRADLPVPVQILVAHWQSVPVAECCH